MPKLTLEVAHTLGQEEAARRLKQRFADAGQSYQKQVSDLRQQWDGHTFSFGFLAMGMKVAGTVAVEQAKVKLAAELPFAAMLFKGAIEHRIREEVGGMLT